MTDVSDIFWAAFSGEMEKIARLPSIARQQMRGAARAAKVGISGQTAPGANIPQVLRPKIQAHLAGKAAGASLTAGRPTTAASYLQEGRQQAGRMDLAQRLEQAKMKKRVAAQDVNVPAPKTQAAPVPTPTATPGGGATSEPAPPVSAAATPNVASQTTTSEAPETRWQRFKRRAGETASSVHQGANTAAGLYLASKAMGAMQPEQAPV